jgi:hypothetical protein
MEHLTAFRIGVALALIFSGGLLYLMLSNTTNTLDVQYGATAGAVTTAAVQFATAQRTTILNAITTAGGKAVSYQTSDLITAGVLDPSISGTTQTGGKWCVMFRSYGGGAHLQGVVTVTGETMPQTQIDATRSAQNTSLPWTGIVINGTLTYAGGSQPLSAFTGASACAPGNYAFGALITDTATIGTTNYLCRTGIASQPSCNTMTVDINMDANNILGANNITASTISTTGTVPTTPGTIAGLALQGTTLAISGNAGTGALTVNGTETVNGAATITGAGTFGGNVTALDYFHTSDGRLKRDWQSIDDPFALLAPIRFGSFAWRADGRRDYGVEAQSLLSTLPELVHRDANGVFSANYDGFVPIFIAALEQSHIDAAAARAQAEKAAQDAAAARATLQRLLPPLAGDAALRPATAAWAFQ